MSKATYFRQCRLVKKIQAGTRHQTSWLPEQFAQVGKVLKLRDDGGVWEDGWQVEAVSQTRLPEESLFDPHQGIKAHRKVTGDSLPKKARR
jgi:hypothetical protein